MPVIVSLGSANPSKVEGARRALARFFPDLELRTIAVNIGNPAQPVGLGQIAEGAVSRAKFALSKGGGEIGLGVEAGIFRLGDVYFDHQQAAIVDSLGRVFIGHSAGYPLPTPPIEAMLKANKELEDYAVGLTGVEAIGDKGGLISYFTNGMVTRADLTDQCVTMALVPLLHRDAFGL